MNDQIIETRKLELEKFIEKALPEFAKACKSDDANGILQHQDAFAADYQMSEYLLLGMAIKYAGIYGKEVRILK